MIRANAFAGLACMALVALLAGCALTSLADAPTPPLATVVPVSTRVAPGNDNNSAILDLLVTVADVDTDLPLEVDTVWLNDKIAYQHVTNFVLFLSSDYPREQDGYEIRLKTAGYDEWVTRIRPRGAKTHEMPLRVHMHRTKPQSQLEMYDAIHHQ